jgi:tetratricopeptide (TPR) repeat protein
MIDARHAKRFGTHGSQAREVSPGGASRLRPEIYGQAFRRACDALPFLDHRILRDRAQASGRVAELREHPWPRRFVLVAHRSCFQTLGVADVLLDLGRRAWTEDESEAERYAELALAVLDHLAANVYPVALVHDFQARAWSQVANARRIRSEFDRSEEAFRRAGVLLQEGTGDASELAGLLELRASLARARRHFDEAERLLRRVIGIYRDIGDRHLEGRGLIGLALLRYCLDEPAEALELIESAATCIDGQREPHLRFVLAKNRALYLSALGRTDEARALLPEARRLARGIANRLDHLRLLWVSALIHRDRGREELAALALRRVVDGFVAERLPFDAALAALDLAVLYLHAGRADDTARFAREIATVFATLDVQPDLLAALALFHQAAEHKSVTLPLLTELSREVRRGGSAHELVGPFRRSDEP